MRVPIIIFVVMAVSLAVARADTITTIDFENTPSAGAGPTLFTSAGSAQTVDVPGVASITGGVVLGLATTLEGNPYVTAPNIYATASNNIIGVGGFGLPDAIVINFASGTYGTQATVPVINGMQGAENYVVTAFDDGAVVSQQTLTNVQSFGYAVANLSAPAITSITIAAADSSAWDFATDTITLDSSLQTAPVTSTSQITAAPEPASGLLALAGVVLVGAARLWAKRASPAQTRHAEY